MRIRVLRIAFAGLAGICLAAAAGAQDRTRALGDLLDSLPADEAGPASGKPDEKPVDQPFAPLLRPPPPGRALSGPTPPSRPLPVPAPEPGRIGTTELPPSAALYPEDAGLAPPADPAELPPPVAIDPPPPPPSAADLAWQAMQEQRRQEINAEEAPLVARLNARMAADQEAARLRAEQAQADHEQALLDREAQIARADADHQAALEAHRRAVARQRAEHEARVAACLAGDRAACAPR